MGFVLRGDNLNPFLFPSYPESVDYFPYFNGQYLALAASLNGGNVVSEFVTMLQGWFKEFCKFCLLQLYVSFAEM